MKYGFLPKIMWTAYKSTIKQHLTKTLNEADTSATMNSAHKKYKVYVP